MFLEPLDSSLLTVHHELQQLPPVVLCEALLYVAQKPGILLDGEGGPECALKGLSDRSYHLAKVYRFEP